MCFIRLAPDSVQGRGKFIVFLLCSPVRHGMPEKLMLATERLRVRLSDDPYEISVWKRVAHRLCVAE